MALRPGDAGRTVRERPTGAGPGGVVIANDGTNLILADADSGAWLNESSSVLIVDDTETNRDAGLFTFASDIEILNG